MTDVSSLIDAMDLAPHPKGGHYRRTWIAPAQVDTPRGSRHSASAIIFLLDRDKETRWYPVYFDELWIWSGPGAPEVHLGGSGDAPGAGPRIVTLGLPAGTQASDASNLVQILVLAGTRQCAFAHSDYALVTCVVFPELTFDDWKFAEGA